MPLYGSARIFKFTNRQLALAAFLACRHDIEESTDVRNVVASNAAALVRPLEFFDIETHAINSSFQEKIDHRLRVEQRLGSDHRNRMERNAVALQRPNTIHHLGMRSLACTVLAVGIVDRLRSIHADPNVHTPFLEKNTPLIVDEHSVGLEGVAYREGIVAIG